MHRRGRCEILNSNKTYTKTALNRVVSLAESTLRSVPFFVYSRIVSFLKLFRIDFAYDVLYNYVYHKAQNGVYSMNRSIVFTKPNTAEFCSSEIPKIKSDEVLVKLVRSSISAETKRANITGDTNTSIYEKHTEAAFPRYGGYSSALF